MEELKCEGIILDILDFQDFHQILTVYSKEDGILKMIRKFGKKKKESISAGYCCDFLYKVGKGDLTNVIEMKVIDGFPKMRERLESIEGVLECLQAIRISQMQGRESEKLYLLFKTVLKFISEVFDPKRLVSSFYLKILLHDGLLGFDSEGKLQESSLAWSLEEEKELYILTFDRTVKRIEEIPLSEGLFPKIKQFFYQNF